MDDVALATLSDRLVVSSLVVYAVAMVAHALGVAVRRSVPADVPVRRAVGASGGATLVEEAPPPAPPVVARNRAAGAAVSLTVLGAGLHLGAVVARGLAAGRAPFGNMYEFMVAAALVAVLVYLALLRVHDVRPVGVVLVPLVLVTLGLAYVRFYSASGELVPQLRSVWLVIHVSAAILSTGAFTVGAALVLWHLWRARAERRGTAPAGGWSAERIDAVAYAVHAFVFPLWTFAVVSGAVWAEDAWGRYWNWDPKETWALITWILYAAYLHARATAGWRGPKAAAIALVGFAALVFNLIGVNLFFSGLHSYAF